MNENYNDRAKYNSFGEAVDCCSAIEKAIDLSINLVLGLFYWILCDIDWVKTFSISYKVEI